MLRPPAGRTGTIGDETGAPPLPIQAKLKVGPVDDPLEHEADRVADQVLRNADPGVSIAPAPRQISRKCGCDEEGKLQKKAAGQQSAAGGPPAIVHEVLRSSGRPLDATVRGDLEPRFGYDFSQMRMHADDAAARSAGALDALAYTMGRNVVFGAGQYRPHTGEGRRLLSHELSHAIQQGAAPRPASQPASAGRLPLSAHAVATPVIARSPGPSHKANDPDQLKSELHPTGKAHLYADQVASIYFGTKSYVPDQDDHKALKALAQEYLYTAQRRGALRGKVIGHADVESSSDPDNQELSFQRARWTAAAFKSYVTDAAVGSAIDLQFDTEGCVFRPS